MTNEQKIKAYLEAGHYVKATDTDWGSYKIYDQPEEWWVISYKIGDGELDLFEIDGWEDCTIEPISRKPSYKVWDKVIVLEIAREIEEYNLLDSDQQEMIWWVFIIESIDFYWIRLNCSKDSRYDDCYTFPSWCLAPYFDDENDERKTKIQELETQLAQIQKDLELLKK